MKLTAVLAITIGAVLFLSTMTSVSYADNGVKIYAKEKQGKMLLLIRNANTASIDGLKITLLDGTIDSAQSNGWNVKKDTASQITISTTKPIAPNGREIFFISTNNMKSIISWSAYDKGGSLVAADNARAILRQSLDKDKISDTNSYIANAKSVSITTDKIFYKSGEKMLISGAFKPDSKITITIYTPTGQKVKLAEQTDKTGSFKALHVLRNAESGTYVVTASEPMAFAETAFKVL